MGLPETDLGLTEWDRKATRAHERKLRDKSGQAGTSSTKGGGEKKSEGSTRANPVSEGRGDVETREETDIDKGDGSEDGLGDNVSNESGSEDETGTGVSFSRRKLRSNTWRYEEPDEEVPGEGKPPHSFECVMVWLTLTVRN